MAIRDLQAKLTEMGRIRIGHRVPTRNGNSTRPAKLDRFKFTSEAEHLVRAVAELYGGEVEPYTGEGVRGRQFAVVTDASDIPVYLPKQNIDPFYEAWAGGVCTRRCDGERDIIHDNPCDCNPEKRACKPTTRLNVMLADVPGIGVWRLESHGIYAAMELSQLAHLLGATSLPIPGRLVLQARARKFFNQAEGKVESRDWFTPVVLIDSVTARQVAIGGDALTQALSVGQEHALTAPPAAPAIEAAPASPPPAARQQSPSREELIERGLARIGAMVSAEESADVKGRIEKMGNPPELVSAWQAKVLELLQADFEAGGRAVEGLDAAEFERLMREVREAEPEGMGGLRDRIVRMGSPVLLVAAWRRRAAEHDAALDAAEAARDEALEGAWSDESAREVPQDPAAAQDPQGGAEEPPATIWNDPDNNADAQQAGGIEVKAAPAADRGDVAAAMNDLLRVAAKRRMGTKAIDERIQADYGVSRYDVTASQLAELAHKLEMENE
jgi:hypothetical protein